MIVMKNEDHGCSRQEIAVFLHFAGRRIIFAFYFGFWHLSSNVICYLKTVVFAVKLCGCGDFVFVKWNLGWITCCARDCFLFFFWFYG